MYESTTERDICLQISNDYDAYQYFKGHAEVGELNEEEAAYFVRTYLFPDLDKMLSGLVRCIIERELWDVDWEAVADHINGLAED